MKTNTGLALFAATLPLGSVLANPAAPAAPAEETSSKGNHHINASGTPRPNIVHIMIDDLGWQDVSQPFWTERTAQNAKFHTPNLERLCSEGARFSQAYAHCVCTPSRIAILTGEHPARTGVTNWTLRKDTSTDAPHATLTPPNWNCNGLQPEQGIARSYSAPTLPQRLAQQGYETIHVGKAHFGAAGTRGADRLGRNQDPRAIGDPVLGGRNRDAERLRQGRP